MEAPRLSLEALREPLGALRALQAFFSIFAFSTCGSFSGSVSFLVGCRGRPNVTVSAAFGYPFRLHLSTFRPSLTHLCNHTWPKEIHLVGDFSSSSRFFVAVGVVSMLLSLGYLGLYLGYLHLYRRQGARLALLDLLVTSLVASLWLGGTSGWAGALRPLRLSLARPLPHCDPPDVTCETLGVTPLGGLGASVGFGFLNLVLWAGSCWFVYKETPFHRPAPPPGPGPAPSAM